MGPSELLGLVARKLEALDIEYLTTGSMASILYGEPRFTNDIDIVIRIAAGDIDRLCDAFPQDAFYVSEQAAAEAVRNRSQFNVIHPDSGLKVDFMIAEQDAFNESRFARARAEEIAPGVVVQFAAPEDVVLRKLEYFKQGGSDKHLRDIRGMLRLGDPPLDTAYIDRWAERLDVLEQWLHVGDRDREQ